MRATFFSRCKNDVTQSCFISPCLSNVYMDGEMKRMKRELVGNGSEIFRGRETWGEMLGEN